MKRMSLFLSAFLALSLAACSTSPNDSSSNLPNSNPPGGDPGGVTPPPSGGPKVPGDADYEVSFQGRTVKFNTILQDDFKPANLSDPFYGGTFEKKLARPSTDVTSLEELSYVMDYCAFYKEASFNINLTYSYSGTVLKECKKAWWNSTTCPGTVGFELSNVSGSSATINFKFNNIAASYTPKEVDGADIVPYVYHNSIKTPYSAVPYTPTNGELDVYNSDQLLYALTHGYEPVFATGSKVKVVYDRACEIVLSTVYQEMNLQERCDAVTWRLCSLASYDNISDEAAAYYNAANAETFPDEACSTFTGGFAEGPLLYGAGFCHGMAKAGAILLSLLNLKVRKVSSNVNPLEDSINGHSNQVGYWSHGYNYVYNEDEDAYVINDPTYVFAGVANYECSGRIFRMSGGYVSVQEWSSVYQNPSSSTAMVDDIFRGTLNEEEILPRYQVPEWTDIFAFNNDRSVRPIADSASELSNIMNGSVASYSNNIQEYIEQYNITTAKYYHCPVICPFVSSGTVIDYWDAGNALGVQYTYFFEDYYDPAEADETLYTIAWCLGRYGMHFFPCVNPA